MPIKSNSTIHNIKKMPKRRKLTLKVENMPTRSNPKLDSEENDDAKHQKMNRILKIMNCPYFKIERTDTELSNYGRMEYNVWVSITPDYIERRQPLKMEAGMSSRNPCSTANIFIAWRRQRV